MAENVIELIVRDHRVMLRLCGRLRNGEAGRRAALGELDELARAHFRAVEHYVHPLVARELTDREPLTGQTAATDLRAERLLALLARGTAGPDTDRVADRVVDAVTEHIRTEEAEVLPALSGAVAPERLESLAELYRADRVPRPEAVPGFAAPPGR
ncbi:hemerythrin domain-containing protein [Kitasatospora sp. NPDC048365]|uniref:hemerythrin domain-containing protein n=1 Tax=Kitasatospora sp. NPDC048365 TaxID=3364050 RepID=UPI0037116D36